MAARILVMNDDQGILDLYGLLLTEEGYDVHLSRIVLEDVHLVEKLGPDCVILDFKFGSDRDGLSLLQQLKMYRPTAHIPVILCTAAVTAIRQQEDILREKGIPLIYKPFDIEDLLAIVKLCIENTYPVFGIADSVAD